MEVRGAQLLHSETKHHLTPCDPWTLSENPLRFHEGESGQFARFPICPFFVRPPSIYTYIYVYILKVIGLLEVQTQEPRGEV